jgi:uncharacterized membrane protein
VIVRVLLLVVLLVGTGWAIWEGVRPGASSRAERLARVGLALTVVGLIWTVFAWWMVIPELILLAGIVLLLIGRRAGPVA